MVKEPSHVKQLSLNHLCKIRLKFGYFSALFGSKSVKNQCCGSETFISDPVSDPDPAFNEFRIRIRFRIRIQIQIRIRIRILDSNPDPDPGFESGSETGQNFFFLN